MEQRWIAAVIEGGAVELADYLSIRARYDLEVANAPLQAKSMDSPRADEAEWVALLEGSDAGIAGAAARATFTLAKLRNFGVSVAPTVGTYRFLFGNQR